MDSTTALIVVDVQNDFVSGSLAVPEAGEIIPVINEYIERFQKVGNLIVFSRDYHPATHKSFKTNGGLWPMHCVAGSHGADFAEGIRLPNTLILVSKAVNPDKESYSAFDGTNLIHFLKHAGTIVVVGLATDYCVKATAIDAAKSGYRVLLGVDAIKGVDINRGDVINALNEMTDAGIRSTSLKNL